MDAASTLSSTIACCCCVVVLLLLPTMQLLGTCYCSCKTPLPHRETPSLLDADFVLPSSQRTSSLGGCWTTTCVVHHPRLRRCSGPGEEQKESFHLRKTVSIVLSLSSSRAGVVMLPLSLLKTSRGHPILIELKNGFKYGSYVLSFSP